MSNYAVINDFDPRTNEKINGTDVEPEAELDFWLRVRLFFLEYFVETFLTVVLALCACACCCREYAMNAMIPRSCSCCACCACGRAKRLPIRVVAQSTKNGKVSYAPGSTELRNSPPPPPPSPPLSPNSSVLPSALPSAKGKQNEASITIPLPAETNPPAGPEIEPTVRMTGAGGNSGNGGSSGTNSSQTPDSTLPAAKEAMEGKESGEPVERVHIKAVRPPKPSKQ